MSGLRKCSKCGKLMKIQNAGPEPMRSDGSFPQHVCASCRAEAEGHDNSIDVTKHENATKDGR